MTNEIVRFHVPCNLAYTSLVENFANLIGEFIRKNHQTDLKTDLRAVLNEVFINVVKHSDTAAQKEVVRFQFELNLPHFLISVYDYGPGFEAGGFYPPYPREVLGERFILRNVVDGVVEYTVVDPFEIVFRFVKMHEQENGTGREKNGSSGLRDHGLGLSIIAKLMDSVTYAYVGQGKYDWKLIKRLG